MTTNMTLAMIQNAGLLLAIAVVFDVVTSGPARERSTARTIAAGVAAGSIGAAMVAAAMTLEPGVIFDTRSVLLSVTALFFGTIPAVIAMIMTAIARILVGGAGTWIGIGVIAASGCIGLAWRRLNRRRLDALSLPDVFAMGLVVHVVMLGMIYMIPGSGPGAARAMIVPVMLVHPLATVALGAILRLRARRQQAEDEVRTTEARFRALAENASDLVYRYELRPARRFSYVSPSSTAITGFTPEEHYANPDLGLELVHPDDRVILESSTAIVAPGSPITLRWVRKDGTIIWTEQRNTPVFDEAGALVAIEGIARDVTAARRAHESLREQEERLRLALTGSKQAFFDIDIVSGIETLSAEYAEMLGETTGQITETREEWLERIHPGDREKAERAVEEYLEGRTSRYQVESRRRRRDGSYVWTLSQGSVVDRDAEGRPLRMLGTITDISAIKQAELEARQAEALAQSTLDALAQNICVLDGEGVVVAVNAAWRRFARENGAGSDVTFVGADYIGVCRGAEGPEKSMAEDFQNGLADVLSGRRATFAMEYPCHSPDEKRWFRAQVTRFRGDEASLDTTQQMRGAPRVVVAHENITERMLAEIELRKVLRAVEQSPVLIVITDIDGNIEYVNPRFVETTGYTLQELVGRNPRILQSGLTPKEQFADLWKTITRGEVWEGVFVNRKKTGEIYHDQATIAPIRGVRGEIVGYVGAKVDITEKMAADEERARLTRILEMSQSIAGIGSWELDLDRNTLLMSDATWRILDLEPDSVAPTVDALLETIDADAAAVAREALDLVIQTMAPQQLEVPVITRAGNRKWIYLTSTVTQADGRPRLVTGAVQDITGRKKAEEERLELTRRLSQAQKLDSLGSLAGGVAHDLNNVLAAISNVAATRKLVEDESDPVARAFNTIAKACERGRSVINSLLYFARESAGSRGPVDLNAIARDVSNLLDHTTLKRTRLTTDLEEPLGIVEGDAPGITQAVINLCLNSLDAMPEGGRITIRTRRTGSDRVELAVIDDGAGMPPEVRERAIDPFFTTKAPGKGTGLGLAMVYGTVVSHGGTLEIESEPGRGTEVTMRFPSSALAAPKSSGAGVSEPPSQESLHVLLVDDDELILETFVPLLEMLGHTVTAVSSGPAAIETLEGGLAPDLVILDMNMPGMSGAEALPYILDLRPSQRVLICTGYSDDDLDSLRKLSPNVESIRKPFQLGELQDAIGHLAAKS